MRLNLFAGIALLIIGTIKAWTHINAPHSLADYLAFRCGSAASADSGWFASLFGGHCWGCPVALIGGLMVSAAAIQSLMSYRAVTWRPVRVRAR